MLRHAKPDGVVVGMEAAALRGAPWGALVAAAGGGKVNLTLSSPDDYEPHDDLLLPLHDSGVRLAYFKGCVGTSAGAAALASVADGARPTVDDEDGAVLTIHMAAPLDLSALRGTYTRLYVFTRPLSPPGPSSAMWPLPPSPPPVLVVQGADEGSWGAVARTITSLAPPGKRFESLELPGCRLRAPELRELLMVLHDADVRTRDWGDGGDTRAEVDGWSGDFLLYITHRWPPEGPAVPSDAELQEAYQGYLRQRGQ
ncbi:uncharacterized protein LOC108681879 [Hyalella azteca]|uniref:Uncharacterized protein LOC108681879 n=1 Tax=Hyalella azteca TaxID=294128 RepID=A0A979FH80_HYAAZ|nr:uncharacterized protein LOC108681879 [Hyalella azteca]